MEQVTAVLAAFVLAFGPLAIGDTKLVDGLRAVIGDDAEHPRPKWLWIAAAMVIALVVCILFEVNAVAPVIALVPRFADTVLNETAGQVLTGLGVGGMASYWHAKGI